MTTTLQPGFRMFSGEQLTAYVTETAGNGVTGPTGPTGAGGSTGATGPTGPTGSAGAGTPVATPANASATGTAGQISYDATHIYVCVSSNTWVRATLATW